MTMSARKPAGASDAEDVVLALSEDERRLVAKAAELQGWTLAQYVRAALLDRAERDLYEQAARADWETVFTASSSEPLTTLATAFSDL